MLARISDIPRPVHGSSTSCPSMFPRLPMLDELRSRMRRLADAGKPREWDDASRALPSGAAALPAAAMTASALPGAALSTAAPPLLWPSEPRWQAVFGSPALGLALTNAQGAFLTAN